MKKLFYIGILLTVVQLLSAQEPNATITVDVQKVKGPVNRLILGNNIIGYHKGGTPYVIPEYYNRGAGIWDPEIHRSVPEMVNLAKESGMSVARYPGGEIVRSFDWKKAVGPIDSRPDQKFGLPEFLQFCTDIKAIPLITVGDYFGTPRDAADLVEYLNGPNDGKHLWARKRAEDGHANPWNVIWFEYGNETQYPYENHKMTAQEYANNYRTYRTMMKAVDPRIRLGAVGEANFSKLSNWFRPVLEAIGKDVDFVIHHAYLPSYNQNDGVPTAQELFSLGLATEAQMMDYYREMNEISYSITGKSIPIAVTEYNGHFVQERPVKYRLTLGNALINVLMLNVFLDPKNNIVMANSWQFSNEYWGAVKGYTYKNEQLVKRPLFYVLQLYNAHLGKELVQADVACGTYNTEGGYGVVPAKGIGQKFQLLPDEVPLSSSWDLSAGVSFTQKIENGVLRVDFQGQDVNYGQARKTISIQPGVGYRVTGEIKTDNLTSTSGACLEAIDSRGWDATHSAKSSKDIKGTTDWQKVEVDYVPLSDAKSIAIQARRVSGKGNITGSAYFKNIEVKKFIPAVFPAVPYLSVVATKSPNGTLSLIVINKNLQQSIKTNIVIRGMQPHSAEAWILTGDSIEATNETDPAKVTIQQHQIGSVGDQFTFEFPRYSLTAIEIK